METEHDVLTVQEAAAFLRVHAATIRAMIQRGDLPAVQLLGAWRIRRTDLDALFTARK